jgi:hypothetical protein
MNEIREFILALRAPDLTPEFVVLHKRIDSAKTAGSLTDEMLAQCTDPECIVCGAIVCPHQEPLHFHHDGCPACDGGCL